MLSKCQGVPNRNVRRCGGVLLLLAFAGTAGLSQQTTNSASQSSPPSQPVATSPATTPPVLGNQSVPQLTTAQEENAKILALAEANRGKPGDYVIGSSDVLAIDVFEVPDLSREVQVNTSGYISLPLIPTKIMASGLTAFQLQDKLAELLQVNGLVSNPQVTVVVKEQHSQPITVVGAVRNPMVYQAVRPTTLLEVLSSAGGIADDAGGVVLVTRNGTTATPVDANAHDGGGAEVVPPTTLTINLDDLINSGDARFNIGLQAGDVVSVPRAGIIYVMGAVQRPGGFVITNDHQQLTTLKALTLAGGLTSTAKGRQALILRNNKETGQRDQLPIDLSKLLKLQGPDVALLPNDILFVPDSSGKRALNRTGNILLNLASGAALLRLGTL
ncbi:MAG TPA: polysaccharide biosynthesis/export family protein [Methylomirabilota bacterium]|nr:polysaccharide biosynthesis/export family protein [Methylomirabilota bacterium]